MFAGTSLAIVACAAAYLMLSPARKEERRAMPQRGFGNAQVLLDIANERDDSRLVLGIREKEIANLMKEKDLLGGNLELLRSLFESEKLYSSELLAVLQRHRKHAENCDVNLKSCGEQSKTLSEYLNMCVEANRKSIYLIGFYFGEINEKEVKMIKEENKKAGVSNGITTDEELFGLFDYFIKEISPKKSVKGQLPRKVGAVLTDRAGDCDEQAITFSWQAIIGGRKARVVFVDYGNTAHAYPQILIGGKKEQDKFVAALKKHYKWDDKKLKKIIGIGTDVENGTYWFTFDTTIMFPGLRIYPDYDKRTRVVYPNGH